VSAVPELDAGEGSVRVDLLAEESHRLGVVGCPEPVGAYRFDVGVGADDADAGVDGGPATLRSHRHVVLATSRPLVSESRAVRHLVEAVLQELGTDLHALEKDLVSGVRCAWPPNWARC